MSRRKSYLFIGIVLGGLLCGQGALAKKHVVLLTTSDLSTHSASIAALGDYYTVEVEIPSVVQGKELYVAFLELYTDVSVVQGKSNRTPVIEAYKLKTAFAGAVNSTQFETSLVALTNVVAGQNKRVILDITGIIKSYLSDPTSNHGIILGSLTGSRDGDFSIRSGEIGPGVFARITYHYDSRVR